MHILGHVLTEVKEKPLLPYLVTMYMLHGGEIKPEIMK
jgi:hypothetical protein